MSIATQPAADALAVLISGGVDSAILFAEALHDYRAVFPLYIRTGLSWEHTELRYLKRFLRALARKNGQSVFQPLTILDVPVADLYGTHWSITGDGVPDETSPDEAVFLPGRNVLLLSKAMLWCHLNDVPALALGHLEANPFPEATPGFLAAFQEAVNQAVDGSVQLVRPYAGLSKTAVISRGRALPLEGTFSCIRPRNGRHCGCCNKCGERRRAFADAGITDRTKYARTGATVH